MKRLMLIGPSQCGKTSLTQVLRGETLRYQKRRPSSGRTAIDTPGEYLENRCLYSALLTSACEADVIALVLNADAPWSPFSPGLPPDEPPGHRGDHQSRFSRPAPSATGPGMARGSRRRTYLYHQRVNRRRA